MNEEKLHLIILDIKRDLEEKLPKMIQERPNLKDFRLFLSRNVDFNIENLQKAFQALQTPIELVDILFGNIVNLETVCDLSLLLSCLENCKISKMYLQCPKLNAFSLKSIEKIKELKEINLRGCSFDSNIEVDCLFVHTKKLVISPQIKPDDFIYKFLGFFNNLEEINLNTSHIDLDILKLKNSLQKNKITKMILGRLNNLRNEELLEDIFKYLSYLHLTASELYIYPYFSMLKNNQILEDFIGINIMNFQDLDLFFSNNKCLKFFKLLSYKGNKEIKVEEQMSILGKALSKTHSINNMIITLNFGGYIKDLVDGLMINSSINTLELIECHINDEDCLLLKEYLLTNKTLTSLNLSENKFSDKGVKYISEGLKSHKYLKILSISYNPIQEEGCLSLKELLSTNQVIEKMKISIKGKGLRYIGEGLILNYNLLSFICDDEFFRFDEIEEFGANLFYNQSLKKIHLGFRNLSIENIIKRNSKLVKTLQIFRNFYIDVRVNFN